MVDKIPNISGYTFDYWHGWYKLVKSITIKFYTRSNFAQQDVQWAETICLTPFKATVSSNNKWYD